MSRPDCQVQDTEGYPMQISNRHVRTPQEQPFILKPLSVLPPAVEFEGAEARGILKRLEEFAKEGCGRLILNLPLKQEPLCGTPQEFRNVGTALVG